MKAWDWLPNLCLIFCTALCYAPTLRSEFTFDDSSAIVENADLRPSTPLLSLFQNDFWGTALDREESHKSYRPITVLTFRLNYLLHQLRPLGYHFINLLLHIWVVLLFKITLKRVLKLGNETAFHAAFLFALHPIHTEAVAGVVGRAELLSSIFFLAALLTHSDRNCFQTGLLAALATFSKEQGITVLGICIVHELYRDSKDAKLTDFIKLQLREKWRLLLGLVAWTILILVLRMLALKGGLPKFTEYDNPASEAPRPIRQMTYNYLLALNAWLLLCPDWLIADWTMGTVPLIKTLLDPRNLATILFYCLLSRFTVKIIRRHWEWRRLTMCLAWIALPFLPSSNLLYSVGFVVAERVLYIPSMGFCALVALGYSKLPGKFHFLFIFTLGVFGTKTFVRSSDWENDWTLFRSALKYTERNAKIYNNLGHFLEHSQNYSEALDYFKRASQVQPDDIGSWVNVGRTFVHLSRTQEAEAAFLHAKSLLPKPVTGIEYTTQLAPSSLKVFLNLGNLYKNQSRLEAAEKEYIEAIAFYPAYVAVYQNLGDIYMTQGKHLEAKGVFVHGLQYAPNSFELLYNLGILEAQRKRKNEALEFFDKALAINPIHFASLLNSAYILSELDKSKAIDRAKQALSLKPDFDPLYRLIGTLLYDTGDLKGAIASFEASIRLVPGSKSALLNLGLIYAEIGRKEDAMRSFKNALLIDPKENKVRLALCDLLVNSFKDPTAGAECYRQALSVEPANVQARHNLCILLVDISDVIGAKLCIHEAEMLLRDPSSGYSVDYFNVLQSKFVNMKE